MDITALPVVSTQTQLMERVSTAVLDQSLDDLETLGEGMVKMMEKSVQPELGQTIDVRI